MVTQKNCISERGWIMLLLGGQDRVFFSVSWPAGYRRNQCVTIIESIWKLTTQCRAGRVRDAVREVASELWDWSKNVVGDVENCCKEALTERI